MRGTGLVVVNGAAQYAYFASFAGVVRVRVSADEFDRLGLHEGQWVRVELPGREPASYLLVKASGVPPVVWLDLTAHPARLAPPAQAAG
jgi:hypothetical protein